MLDSLRKKQNNLVFSFILVATAVVMCFVFVPKMGGDEHGQGGAAAVVNGEIITRRDFQQNLEMRMMQYQQMLGSQYDEKLLLSLQVPQRTLEDLIQMKLLAQQAKRLGVIVPDTELAEYIRSLPYYQKDGKFDAATYAKIPNPGVEETRQRERLQVVKFQNYLVDRVKMTPAEARQAYDLKETKVDLDYAKIDFNQLAARATPSAKEIDAFLKATPEKDFQAFYDAHRKDFTDKAQVQLRQIRVGIPYQAKPEQKAEAKKKVEAIAKEVTPENFAEVAKKKSDDEYAKKGGAVGWVPRGTLEQPIELAIDKLQPKGVSAPIETTFGYYIVQVLDKKPEMLHSIAEVKRDIAERLLTERNKKSFVDTKKAEYEKILAAGKPLDPELKKAKIEVNSTGPFSIGQGAIPTLGQADNIVDAVFQLTPKNPVGKKLYPVGDSFYYIKLKSVEYPKKDEFAKNRDAVERGEENALQMELMTKWVAGLEKNASIKQEIKF